MGAHSLYYHAFLAKKNKMDMLNLLFELGLDVNVVDAHLHYAADAGGPKYVGGGDQVGHWKVCYN